MSWARAMACLAALAGLFAPGARAAEVEWHSEQPVAAGIEVPVPLGPVGDIEFWEPNRGALITQGNQAMPAGVYAYDGTGWHLYSTVCGGHEGRVAWAGPTEFWTVSDFQVRQEGVQDERLEQHRSLCHFKDGRVVGSYAEPIGSAGSYLRMNAAACAAPGDCWFAGERLPGSPNSGAFHLHWDGQSLTAVPSLSESQPELGDPGRAVKDLAFYQGQFFESVEVQAGDEAPDEVEPSFLHRIDPISARFVALFPSAPYSYGSGPPTALDGFRLAGNGTDLWAVAGGRGSGATRVIATRYAAGAFSQVPLPEEAQSPLKEGDRVFGAAAEPGSGDLWLSFCHRAETCEADTGNGGSAGARLVRVAPDGAVEALGPLPAPSEGIGFKGFAGPIACAAPGQCWMATSRGWLFHLGGSLPRDPEPAMHALITERPCDNSCPKPPTPEDLPADDSGSELPPEIPAEPIPRKPRQRPKARPIVAKVKQRVVDETLLELSFTLRARAHVRVLARFHKRVVAETPKLTLGSGRHRLRLRLDRRRWPTSLDFQVHAAGGRGAR